MAKKKTKDTKGLAGVIEYGKSAASGKDIRLNKKVKPANQGGGPNYLGEVETVTVPKQWLSSPDHVIAELAYITPAEQKILLEANLYGSLDGVPNRGPGGLMSLQGDMSGGSYGGGGSEGESEGRDAASSSSSSNNDSGIDASTGIDAETDDPDTAGAGSRVTGYQGPDSPGGERMGTPGRGLSDYYGGSGIDGDNRNTTKEEFGASIVRNNQLLGGSTGTRNTTWFTDIGSAGQEKARGAIKGLVDAEIERRRENAKSGYGLKDTPLAGIGSIFGAMGEFNLNNISKALENPESIPAFDAQGKIQGAYTPGPFGLGMVYTGNPIEGFEETGWTPDDNKGDNEKRKKTTVVSVTDAKVSAVPTSPPSYYGQGVGTATTNLYDPTKIDPYLASLYGITPSPIGATYDAATSSYYMPGSKRDAKSRTRLRGLDIFKPVSTVS